MKRVVVFSGSGISSESGIATYRAKDGLWANHRIEDVCTPEALVNNRVGVVEFYNQRRLEVQQTKPNDAHIALKRLENHYDVKIVTQNIDDLHERAGSSSVLHLHGEINKLCSSKDHSKTVQLQNWRQNIEDRHVDGSYLRPFIVFFGEAVPMLEPAIEIAQSADIFIVIGTSLQVYPAASLLHYVKPDVPVYIVDPNIPPLTLTSNPLFKIESTATQGVTYLVNELIESALK